MVIFVGKFFGNMVISITTHWSFRLYGPFLAGPDVDHISGIDCSVTRSGPNRPAAAIGGEIRRVISWHMWSKLFVDRRLR